MAGRGFPPAPDSLKLLQGLPGRRPLRGQAPTILDGPLTEPTELLDVDGLKVWRYVVPILVPAGLATPADVLGLTALCQVSSVLAQVQRALTREGVIVTRHGKSEVHTLVKSIERLLPIFRLFLAEYGLTPAARSRIKVDQPQPKSKVDEFRAKHGDVGRDA